MERPFRHLVVQREDDVFCARLRSNRMNESDILEMADEVRSLVAKDGCRKLVLSLGPGPLECLYSVFLSKLVMIRRELHELGGELKICEATRQTLDVFEACQLRNYFDFLPDQAAAVAGFSA